MTMNKQKFDIKNLEDHPKIIIIEPWGEEIILESGKWASLEILSDKEGNLEFFLEQGCIIVYAWDGCVINYNLFDI